MANMYWTTPAADRITHPARHLELGLSRRLGTALKALQYGRMVSVLDRLPDAYLDQAGLRRSDIPEHARRIVYDGE